MGGSAMLVEEYNSSTYRYWLLHGATCLRNINEVIQPQHFYLSLVTMLNVIRNISTAESLGRNSQRIKGSVVSVYSVRNAVYKG